MASNEYLMNICFLVGPLSYNKCKCKCRITIFSGPPWSELDCNLSRLGRPLNIKQYHLFFIILLLSCNGTTLNSRQHNKLFFLVMHPIGRVIISAIGLGRVIISASAVLLCRSGWMIVFNAGSVIWVYGKPKPTIHTSDIYQQTDSDESEATVKTSTSDVCIGV